MDVLTADVVSAVVAEATAAAMKYGPFASAHEALGVLAEECQELAEAVRSHSLGDAAREALQVAAVAARLASQLSAASVGFKERSQLWP